MQINNCNLKFGCQVDKLSDPMKEAVKILTDASIAKKFGLNPERFEKKAAQAIKRHVKVEKKQGKSQEEAAEFILENVKQKTQMWVNLIESFLSKS